jgi:aldose 1-epimerase
MGSRFAVLMAMSTVCFAQNYRAERLTDHGVEIVRLTDTAHSVEVSIVPSIGNRGYEMKVGGENILHFPAADIGEFQQRPMLSGIPFLAPWADLLSEPGFWADGKHFAFNMELGNVRGKMPSHGLLVNASQWRVTEVAADAHSAHVTSRLEFWRYPDLMAQWPFAHEYEMTYSLADGALEVRTAVTNLSDEPMPMVLGFHPYLRIPGIPREEWTVHSPARIHVIPGEHNIPTGEMRPLDIPNPLPLRGVKLDDGFTDLARGPDGRANFSIEAGGKKVEIIFGPKFTVATMWIPEGREFLCIEPLATIINGVNLAHEGKYPDLQSVPGRAKWIESFWIRATL